MAAAIARRAGGLRLVGVTGHDATHYPLGLMALPGEQLRLRLDYRPDLFERAERGGAGGNGSFGCWRRRSRRRSAAIGSLDILSAAERATILRGWNDTAHAVPDDHLAGAVCGAGGKTPDATAVVFEQETLSLRRARTCAPTGWRITCADRAWGRRRWWGCASSARST